MAAIMTSIREAAIGVRVLPRIDGRDNLTHVVAYHLPGMRYAEVSEHWEFEDAAAEANRLRVGL